MTQAKSQDVHAAPAVLPRAPDPLNLANPAEAGATLYNSYLFLTQTFALYAEIAKIDVDGGSAAASRRQAWLDLADSAVNDLGDLYQLWEAALTAGKNGSVVLDEPAFGKTVARACKRLDVLVRRLNLWVPIERWARLLAMAEQRWIRLLERAGKLAPDMAPKLAPLTASARLRASRLSGLLEQRRKSGAVIDETFRVAMSLGVRGS
jgi:hypothetical protein